MVGKPTSSGVLVGILSIALVTGGVAIAVPSDPQIAKADPGIVKLNGLVDLVNGSIATVKDLLKRSQRESTAMRTSCIEDKLKDLELKKTQAQGYLTTFQARSGDPAGQQKLLDDSNVLEIYSAALVRDAKNCKDATATQVRLEVEYNGSQAPVGEVPSFDPVPRVRYDRPPLASPF
jgi:hypothetical protein